MAPELLKDKIHRAIEKTEDLHLLEMVFSLLNRNSRFNEFEFFAETSEKSESCKTWEPKAYAFTEVRKKILENLEK